MYRTLPLTLTLSLWERELSVSLATTVQSFDAHPIPG